MTTPLRERLAKILASARPTAEWPPWDSPWERDRDHWREIADALLASEEWKAREAVVEAADAYVSSETATATLGTWHALIDSLARLDAMRGEEKAQ